MDHPAFTTVRRHTIPALHVEFQEYRHHVTGARHIHLAADEPHNAFMVAFLTVPQDSTGVAHILEHTALCGSRRYPVRDPFFMMTRRSLNTFMNAFTSSDWTAYPFASQNRKDFSNLLDVYLDAVFFPSLDELDFAQEGCRVEFSEADNPASDLVYKGVVFNEMKGALSSPVQNLGQSLQSLLFPTTTYHHNSGGDPEDIPRLTHAQLRAFHARHYHPSNAIFMTYGDIPAAEHQARFEDRALSAFQALPLDLSIPDERRYREPSEPKPPMPWRTTRNSPIKPISCWAGCWVRSLIRAPSWRAGCSAMPCWTTAVPRCVMPWKRRDWAAPRPRCAGSMRPPVKPLSFAGSKAPTPSRRKQWKNGY